MNHLYQILDNIDKSIDKENIIFLASQEGNSKLRRIYQELFGSSEKRRATLERLDHFYSDLTFSPVRQHSSLLQKIKDFFIHIRSRRIF